MIILIISLLKIFSIKFQRVYTVSKLLSISINLILIVLPDLKDYIPIKVPWQSVLAHKCVLWWLWCEGASLWRGLKGVFWSWLKAPNTKCGIF